MFADGLIEEVQSILNRGFSPESKALQSLGYSQVLGYLRGELTLAETLDLTKRETRHYAKRQLTWFRKESEVSWYEDSGNRSSVQVNVLARVRVFLESFGHTVSGPRIKGAPGPLV